MFLPLWNNVDYSGEVWKESLPTEEEGEGEEEGRGSDSMWSKVSHI